MVKLPNANRAEVPKPKIVDYLLSPIHGQGKSKAAFFLTFGFSQDRWLEFAEALRNHAISNEVTIRATTSFGTRYVVDGALRTPSGQDLHVRVAWFIPDDTDCPRLVTAHPLKRKNI